jgi:hypothetical protein
MTTCVDQIEPYVPGDVVSMVGDHRIPTLLTRVDRLARTGA